MKKTLFLLRNFFNVGGSAKVYRELCRRLPASEIYVLTRQNEGPVDDRERGYPCKTVSALGIGDKRSWVSYIRYLIGLIKELKVIKERFNFEVICLENALEVEAVIAHIFFKVPIVFYCHGEEFNSDRWSYNWLKRRILYPCFDRNEDFYFIAVSRASRDLIGSYIGGNAFRRTMINKNGVDMPKNNLGVDGLEELRAEYGLADKFVILTVSRFDKRKGHGLFLPVLKRLIKKFDNVIYITIGDGECLPEFKEQVKQLGLEGHVRHLGYLTEDLKERYYRLSDLFLLLCYTDHRGAQEGFGLVFLEANSYGVPVIAGNSGGVLDSVSHGVSGFVVDPFDQEDVYTRISRMISDREELARLRISSKQWAAKFSWDTMTTQFKECIRTVK